MKKIKLLSICLAFSMMLPLAGCGREIPLTVTNRAAGDVEIVLNEIATAEIPVYTATTVEGLEEQKADADADYEVLRKEWEKSCFALESKEVYLNAISSAQMAEEEAGGTASDKLGIKVKGTKKGFIVSQELVYPTRNVILYITYNNNLVVTDISFTPVYSFGEVLKKAGLNTLIGMSTVFIVLILIMFIIMLFGLIPQIQKKIDDKKAKKAAKNTDIVTELTSLLKAEQEHSKHLSEQNTIMLNTIQQQSDIIQQYTVTIQHLTDRLASEQQLHAGSIKALLTEQVKTDEQNISSDDTESHSDEQIVEEASLKRCSLFSRIFKKNK